MQFVYHHREGHHIIQYALRGISLSFRRIYVFVVVSVQRVRSDCCLLHVCMRAGMLSSIGSLC